MEQQDFCSVILTSVGVQIIKGQQGFVHASVRVRIKCAKSSRRKHVCEFGLQVQTEQPHSNWTQREMPPKTSRQRRRLNVVWLWVWTTYLKMEGSIHHAGHDLHNQAPQTLVVYWAQIKVSNSCLDGPRVCHSHTHSMLVLHEESCNGLSQAREHFFLSKSFWAWSWSAMLKQKEHQNPDHVTPPWGGGMQAKTSKIVILCYYQSFLYLINHYKNIQNIKNCLLRPAPPGRGGVRCDTPVSNVLNHPPDVASVQINMEVPAPGDSLSWDTKPFVCDITTENLLLAWTPICHTMLFELRNSRFALVLNLFVRIWHKFFFFFFFQQRINRVAFPPSPLT